MRQRIPHIADGSIDLVLFCLSLEHVEELQAPIDEALRIVRPRGGRIAIVEIHPFLSFSGVAAHFDDGDDEVRMPAFPHPFAAYLNAFAARNLRVTCREWRPRDIGNPPQLQGLKRGPDFPLSVEFSICL
jgi:malonyl-CoA O-methyltransferase